MGAMEAVGYRFDGAVYCRSDRPKVHLNRRAEVVDITTSEDGWQDLECATCDRTLLVVESDNSDEEAA